MFTYNINIYERNLISSVKVDTLSFTLKLDESLDTGVLVIPRSLRKNKISRFSRVEISIYDGTTTETTYWLTYSTKVEIESRGVNKRYKHTLALIEPTKWLEKFIVGSMTFTQPLRGTQKTLYDYVERVRQIVPLVPNSLRNTTRLFTLDPTFKAKIENVIAPQMYLDKKNLREVLIELFKVVNAIPRLYYNDGWVLTGDFINQKQLEIEIGDGDIDYMQEASGDNLAQTVEMFHENTVVDNIIYEGSQTDYISFRNDNVILGTSDLKLLLSQPISELYSIECYFLTRQIIDGVTREVIVNGDITNYIFEKKVYDSLDMDMDRITNYQTASDLPPKAKSIYWTYKSNKIEGFSEKFGEIFETLAIQRILDDKFGLDNIFSFWDIKLFNTIFKVTYKPYIESMRTIEYREDISPYSLELSMLDEYSGIIINPGERLNEIYDLSSNIYGQIQRVGVDTVSFSKKHYKLADSYKNGDYTADGYYITKVEKIFRNSYFVGRYEASKNWNRISQFVQLDKEFRPYEVSLANSAFTLKRDINLNIGFVEISTEPNYVEQRVDYSKLRTIFMDTFNSYPTNQVITTSIIVNRVSDFPISKTLVPIAVKNGLKWKLSFNDTKLLGKSVELNLDYLSNFSILDLLSGLRRIQTGVYYTQTDGTLEDLKLQLYSGIQNNSPSDNFSQHREFADFLPYVSVDHIKNTPIIETEYYLIKKDGAEVLGGEITLPVLPRYDEINRFIIGDNLLKENLLIKQRDTTRNLYFYGLNYELTKFDTEKLDLANAVQLSALGTIGPFLITVPENVYIYDTYAIADVDGYLYLGVNQLDFSGVKTIVDVIHFNFLNSRTQPPTNIFRDNINIDIDLIFNAEFIYKIQEDIIKQLDIDLTLNAEFNYEIYEYQKYKVALESLIEFDSDIVYDIYEYQHETSIFNADFDIDSDLVYYIVEKQKEVVSLSANLALTSSIVYDIITTQNEETHLVGEFSFNAGLSYNIKEETHIQVVLNADLNIQMDSSWYEGGKTWESSNFAYYSSMTPSNRIEDTVVDPSSPATYYDPYEYQLPKALRLTDGTLPLSYSYYKLIHYRR